MSGKYKYMYMTLIIHEMLRKTRQGNTTQQKDKATQHNSPKAVIFQRKLAASGGIFTGKLTYMYILYLHTHTHTQKHTDWLMQRRTRAIHASRKAGSKMP